MSAAFLPAFALTCAITGHRRIASDQLERINRQLAEVLVQVKDAASTISLHGRELDFFQNPPVLRLATCLSEGADRIAAKAALANGYAIQVFLPFPKASPVHAMDFEPEAQVAAREELKSLCDLAESVLELNPEPPQEWQGRVDNFSILADEPLAEAFRQDAYLEASLAMLDQADMLIAIWNGKAQAAYGSSFDIIRRALKMGMPVCVIRSDRDAEVQVWQSWQEFRDGSQPKPITVYDMVIQNWGLANKGLADKLADMKKELAVLSRRPMPAISGLWNKFQKLATASAVEDLDPGPYKADTSSDFSLFDGASNYCAAMHRSTFIALSFLAVLAVLCSALMAIWPAGFHHGLAMGVLAISQASLLGTAIVLAFRAKRSHWQSLLTSLRLVAELLRLNRYGAPLGLSCISHFGDNSLYNKKGEDWLEYIIRNQIRLQGAPPLDLSDPGQFSQIKSETCEYLIRSQFCYHRLNSVRSGSLGRKMAKTGSCMYYLSLLVAGARFSGTLFFDMSFLNPVVVFFGAMGPVIANHSHAIAQNAELQRLAVRSAHLAKELEKLHERFMAVATATDLRKLTSEAQKLMVRDVEDWRDQYNMPK